MMLLDGSVTRLWPKSSNGSAPLVSYWSPSITSTIGPTMGMEASKYISYPAQVLAKSLKMIPVMLMGTLIYGVEYTIPDYICTFLVAGGVSAFALQKLKDNRQAWTPQRSAWLWTLLTKLAFDGYTMPLRTL